jgi:hypothetical protein
LGIKLNKLIKQIIAEVKLIEFKFIFDQNFCADLFMKKGFEIMGKSRKSLITNLYFLFLEL